MSARRQLAAVTLALSALLGLAGCGPKPLPPPPRAPVVTGAADFIPPDLDVVARLDFEKVRQALGGPALELLAREALERSGARGEEALLVSSLLEAEVVWLGFRPGPGLLPLDRVLSLQGRFSPLPGAPDGFSHATDLGADVRFYERRRAAPAEPVARSATARLYAAGDRVRAFVSLAELDAVERVLTGAGAERRLAPPEQGTLSLSARPRVPSRLFGGAALGELFERGKQLTLVAELEADAVSLKLELELASDADAERLRQALESVASQRLSGTPFAESAKLSVAGARLGVRARISRAQLGVALLCLREPTASRCTW